jgi:hypothetical protein
MDVDKRKGLPPIPHPVNFFLNPAQIHSIKVLRQFGWQLVCLRREDVPDITPMLWNRIEQRPGALGPDGALLLGEGVRIRSRRVSSVATA